MRPINKELLALPTLLKSNWIVRTAAMDVMISFKYKPICLHINPSISSPEFSFPTEIPVPAFSICGGLQYQTLPNYLNVSMAI